MEKEVIDCPTKAEKDSPLTFFLTLVVAKEDC